MKKNIPELGTMFVEQLGASTLQELDSLITRLCSPTSCPQFDALFGVPETDAAIKQLSARLTGDGGYRFPTLQISEAIKAHPNAHLTRYHFDRHTEKFESMIPGWGAHHGVELFFVFGNNTCKNILSEERVFAKKVQSVWIEFVTAASPEASSLPKVTGSVLPSAGKAVKKGGEGEAIVFGSHLEISRGAVERLSVEEVDFWSSSYAYTAEQTKLRRAGDVGFNLAKGIRP